MKKGFAVLVVLTLFTAGAFTFLLETDMSGPSYRNVRYGSHERNVMDIYLPETNSERTPVFLYIHGGGWTSGDKSEGRDWLGPIRGKGYVLVSMNYRFITPYSDDNETCENILDDIHNAIEYLRSSSDIYGIDPTGMAIGGYSAGAHLSLLYSYSRDSPIPIELVVSKAGPTDFTDPRFYADQKDRPGYPEYVGMTPRDAALIVNALAGTAYGLEELRNGGLIKPKIEAISPISYITADNIDIPYTILAHGERDNIIPVSSSLRLNEKMNKTCGLENACELVLFPYSGHDLNDPEMNAVLIQRIVTKIDLRY